MSKRKPKFAGNKLPSPEAVAVINGWIKFARANHLVFSPFTDIPFKASVVVEYDGACPCKRYERPVCPCKELKGEIARFGVCFCRVFCSPEYSRNPDKFPHETFEDSNG